MNNDKKLCQKYIVRPSECNFRGKLSIAALCGYLQDSAGMHANILGIGVDELLKKNHTWMLSRFRVEICESVECWDSIEIITWPSGKEKLFTFREFEARNKSGKLIAKAATAWLTYDIKARRLVRPFPELEKHFYSERVFEMPLEKLGMPETFSNQSEFSIRKGHIDINNHATNLAYIEWITESVPESTYFFARCCELELNYINEALLSDRCVSRIHKSAEKNEVFYHQINKTESSQEVCRARTRWEKTVNRYSVI